MTTIIGIVFIWFLFDKILPSLGNKKKKDDSDGYTQSTDEEIRQNKRGLEKWRDEKRRSRIYK